MRATPRSTEIWIASDALAPRQTSPLLVSLCALLLALSQADAATYTHQDTTGLTGTADWGDSTYATSDTTSIMVFGSSLSSASAANLDLGSTNVAFGQLQFKDPGGPITIKGSGTMSLSLGTMIDMTAATQDVTINTAISGTGILSVTSGQMLTLAGGGAIGSKATGAGTIFLQAASAKTYNVSANYVVNAGSADSNSGGLVLGDNVTLNTGAYLFSIGSANNTTGLLKIDSDTAQWVFNGSKTIVIGNNSTTNGKLLLLRGKATGLSGGELVIVSARGTGVLDMRGGELGLYSGASTSSLGSVTGTLSIAKGIGAYSGTGSFLMSGGVASVYQINFGGGSTSGTGSMNLTGGELYVGSGGITSAGNGSFGYGITLAGGTLGALAGWNSSLSAQLGSSGTTTIKAADSSNAAYDITLSGVLSGAGGFAKTGAGVLTLSGSNTYNGNAAINAGTLSISSTAALSGWNASGRFAVANGAALAIGNGVADGDLATMLGTTNFAAGASVGFDTSAGDRAYSGAIANTSQGTLGLVKVGANTLTLSASNSYSGATTLSAGILKADHANALGGGGDISFKNGTLQYTANSAGQDWGTRIKSSTSAIAIDTNSQSVTLGALDSSNTGGLTKLGAGKLILTASNSYSGITTIGAGTLQVNHPNALSTGTVTFSGGTLQHTAASAGQDWASRIKSSTSAISIDTNGQSVSLGALDNTNTGGLAKLGAGTLTLSASNSYTGATTIGAGTLQANHANALSSGTITFTGGTLQYTAASAGQNWGSRIKNSTSAIGIDTNNQSVSLGALDSSNTGGLTKLGAGTLNLTANNTYAGATAISSGTLKITEGSIASSSGITNNSALVYDLSTNADSFSNSIAGTGSLTKLGTNTLTLSGNNSYSGATTLSAGTLKADHASALGSGTITFSGGTLQYTANSAGSDWGSRIQSSASAITIDTNGQSASLGTLDSSNTGGLTKTAALGTLILSGNSNSFTGNTQLNGGTLRLDYSTNNNTKLADSGTLQLYGGTLELAGGSHTEVVANTTLNTGATIIKRSSGSGILSTGSLTFTGGAVNFEAGGIAIVTNPNLNTGILNVRATVAGADFAMRDGSGNVVAYNGYSNWGSGPGSAQRTYSLTGNSTYTTGSANSATMLKITTNGSGQSLTLNANLQLNGLLFAGANDYTIGDNNNTYSITLNSILHNYGAGTLSLGKLGKDLVQAGTGKTILTAAAVNDYTMSILGGSVQISNDNQIGTGATSNKAVTLNNGTLIADTSSGNNFSLASASYNRPISLVTAGTLDVTGGNTFTVPGVISGAGQLTFGSASSNGVFSLTGANTYAGSTVLAGGTISLGVAETAGTSGPLGKSAAANAGSIVLNGGYLQHTASNTNDYSGRFSTAANQKYNIDTNGQNVTWATALSSSGGDLNKKGTGTLTLSAANTLSGTARVMAGALSLSHTNALQNATLDMNNADSGSLSWDASGDYTLGGLAGSRNLDMGSNTVRIGNNNSSTTYSGALSSGALTKIGSGTLTLTGNNSYAGATTINSGVLSINSTNGLAGTSGVSIAGGASLLYTGGAATFAKNITVSSSGTGTVNNNGGGLLTLSGTLTKDGKVLRLTGGSFDVTGAIVGSSANSDLLVDAATVTLSGSNSYNGPTYIINSGTLNANVSNALPTANGRTDIYMDQTGSGNSRLSLGTNQSVASLSGAASSTVALNANTLTVGTASGTSSFAGVISGVGGSLVKDNNSTQILSGNNSYTGATSVTGGKLLVSGSLSGSTSVSVATGATLELNTALVNNAATMTVDGTLQTSGGNSNIGALTLNNGATFAATITGTATGSHSVLNTTGIALSGSVTLSINSAGYTLPTSFKAGDITTGERFALTIGGYTSGAFANVSKGTDSNYSSYYTFVDANNHAWAVFYGVNFTSFSAGNFSATGSDIALVAIPEPNSFAMLLGGFGMLLFAQRIRGRRSH